MLLAIFLFHILGAVVSAVTTGALWDHYRSSPVRSRANLFFLLFFFFFIFFNLAIAFSLLFGLERNIILGVGYIIAMTMLYTGLAFITYVPFAVLPIPSKIADVAKTILPWVVVLAGFVSLSINIFELQEPFITSEGTIIWNQPASATLINMLVVVFTAVTFLVVFIYGSFKATTLVTKLKSLLIGVGAGILGTSAPFFFFASTVLETMIYLIAIVLGVIFVLVSAYLKEGGNQVKSTSELPPASTHL